MATKSKSNDPFDDDSSDAIVDDKLNFADVQSGSLLPNGRYYVMVTGFELTETQGGKAPGTPMVKAEYTVSSGEYENRKVWDNLVLNKESLWKAKQFLLAAGMYKEEVDSWNLRNFLDAVEDERFMERDLDLTVKQTRETEEYDARNQVSGYKVHTRTVDEMLP